MKPTEKEFENQLIKAGLMREADRGKKSYRWNYRKAIPDNAWLTVQEIRKKVWGKAGNVGGEIGKWASAGILQRMWTKEGDAVYSWPGTKKRKDLVDASYFKEGERTTFKEYLSEEDDG